MKSLLILISSLGEGGAERVACRLASELSDTGRYNVYIMPFSKTVHSYHISENVKVLNYAPFVLRKKRNLLLFLKKAYSSLHMYAALFAFQHKYKPDVTLSMLLTPNVFNVLIPYGGRKVLSERNNPRRKGFIQFILSKWTYQHGDLIIFQNKTVRDLFSLRITQKSCILPNPVSVACTARPERCRKIVNAGKLKPQKNQLLLVRAFASFYRTHADYTLVIYGQGPLKEKLEEEIRKLGLKDAAFIKPFSDDLHKEIADAEIFVLSSDYEGQPNALMEAMMMGIACISTDYDGEPVISDHETGLIVDKGDPAALANAMSLLADDAELRSLLEQNAREYMNGYSPDKVIPQWEKALFQ